MAKRKTGQGMKILILVEGQTELFFLPFVQEFVANHYDGPKPKLKAMRYDGRIPKGDKLKRIVGNSLQDGYDAVIALTDVYTGTADFKDATDAKRQMREWAGNSEKFYPHAAQYDFEAWLLPYWDDIKKIAKHNKNAPPGKPESVNHNHPPSWHLKELFRVGAGTRDYIKTRDAKKILQGKDLKVAANACPELKAFLNTILTLCGAENI